MQRMHLHATCAQFHHLVADLHDVGETNFVKATGQANPAYFRGHDCASFRCGRDVYKSSISDGRLIPLRHRSHRFSNRHLFGVDGHSYNRVDANGVELVDFFTVADTAGCDELPMGELP